MKKIFILLLAAISVLGYNSANAQSFTIPHDTVVFNASGVGNVPIHNDITPTSGTAMISWNIVSTNFPADWIANCGMCDTFNCYNLNTLYPSGAVRTCGYSSTSTNHDFHLLFNGASSGLTTNGSYYIRVKLVNHTTMDSTYSTFVVNKYPTAVPTVSGSNEELNLYPNPATSEINIVYGGAAEIKTAAIYNIIGKPMAIYKVNGNNANISLDNMAGGIYFVRLSDAQGQVVATRKFTKQ